MRAHKLVFIVASSCALHLVACGTNSPDVSSPSGSAATSEDPDADAPMKPFDRDVAFLKQHTDVVVLGTSGARVAVVPQYQGRVMTSTAGGDEGRSYGWLNRDAIASGERLPHINVFGGEDRFWMGPEGGQFSIFFERGDPFDLEHWQTPEAIDWGGWEVTSQTTDSISFAHEFQLANYSGHRFSVQAERTVRVLADARRRLGLDVPDTVAAVGFESDNRITNSGDRPWDKPSGLLSIWILGMFNPSPATTVVLPFEQGQEETHGPVVNDAYFGKVPDDRLRVEPGVVFFRGDGEHRSKIGVNRARAKPIIGSFDADNAVLTLVHYTLLDDAVDYVNSMWEIQAEPFAGDVVNSYNDGPPAPGAPPLGPFYELESSSPAAELAPGESMSHIHQTFHFEGPRDALDAIAQATLGVSLDDVGRAFSP